VPELDPRDARIAELEGEVAALKAQVAELLARLGQTSQNSSKPPSSDPPGAPRSPKEPTGRARQSSVVTMSQSGRPIEVRGVERRMVSHPA